jgi:methionyl-tRNA formyltransferase
MNRKCILIGGRQLGVNCFRLLLERGIRPEFVISDPDDNGIYNGIYESLVNESRNAGVTILVGSRIKDRVVIGKINDCLPVVIFHVGGTQLIPKEVIQASAIGCSNLHPALLPKYRGRFSTVHALFNGEKETGVTLHWLDEGMDSGPIIMQEKYPIEENDTGKTLFDKFTKAGIVLFGRFVDMWLSGEKIQSYPQDEEQATYYPKGIPNNGEIDWSWDSEKIKRFIRAMTYEPFPPASFKIGDKEMVIIDKKYFEGFD